MALHSLYLFMLLLHFFTELKTLKNDCLLVITDKLLGLPVFHRLFPEHFPELRRIFSNGNLDRWSSNSNGERVEMGDKENKENNYSISCTPLNRKSISLQKTWSSNRFTPYKTPSSQRFARLLIANHSQVEHQNASMRDPGRDITNLTPPDSPERLSSFVKETPRTFTKTGRELSEITSDIRFVTGKTWRLHQCSPLFSFKTSSLQSYRKLLFAHLESMTAKRLAFEVGEDACNMNCKFEVELSVLQEFSFFETDERAIKVTVHQTSQRSITAKNSPTLLDAIFCNFRNDFQNVLESDGFTCLPLCLVKGPVGLAKCVLSWFQAQFDCTINPFKLPPIELTWCATLWAGIAPEKRPSKFELSYNIPSAAKGLKRMSFSIDTEDVKLLWDSCHSNDSDIFTGEESEAFINALDSHFYRHFKVHLGSLSLSRICTTIACLSGEGQIKILQDKYVRHILQQITAAAQDRNQFSRL